MLTHGFPQKNPRGFGCRFIGCMWVLVASGDLSTTAETSEEPNSAARLQQRAMININELSSGALQVSVCGSKPITTTATGDTIVFDDGERIELKVLSNTRLQGMNTLSDSDGQLQVELVKVASGSPALGAINLTSKTGAGAAVASKFDVGCFTEIDIDTTYSGNGFTGNSHSNFLTVTENVDEASGKQRAVEINQISGNINGHAIGNTELIYSVGDNDLLAPAPGTGTAVVSVKSEHGSVSATYSGVAMVSETTDTTSLNGDFSVNLL